MARDIRLLQWCMLLVEIFSIVSGQGSLDGMERFAKTAPQHAKRAAGHATSQADVLGGDLSATTSELDLLQADERSGGCCGDGPPPEKRIALPLRNGPAGPQRACCTAPGAEAFHGKLLLLRRSLQLKHCRFQLSRGQKLLLLRRSLRLEAGVLLLQLGELMGLLGLHARILLAPTVIGLFWAISCSAVERLSG